MRQVEGKYVPEADASWLYFSFITRDWEDGMRAGRSSVTPSVVLHDAV